MTEPRKAKKEAGHPRAGRGGVGKPLPQTYQHLVHTLKERLAEVAGDRMQAVIVYGSRAWG